MFIHDTLKIKYSREGFLPDYPYHLISDEEMFEAFIRDDDKECFFYDTYPCPEDARLQEVYAELIAQIKYHIEQYLVKGVAVPNWVYSYMMGSVIGPNSDLYDIHDMLVLINCDNIEDDITLEAYNELYKVSLKYIQKLKDAEKEHRPPTFFGELHVIKILRLEQSEI